MSCLLPATRAVDADSRHFDIPAGDAAVTLKTFAAQSNEQLLFSPDDVRGVQTHAIRGEFTPAAAIEAMLDRTPLRARQDAVSRAIAITARPATRATDTIAPSSATPSSAVKSKNPFAVLGAWLALAIAPAATAADGSALPTGSIEGRVFSPATGRYIANARVAIEAQHIETFTDETGLYRLARIPAGDVALQVSYTGYPVERETVRVTAGQSAQRDFTLRASKDTVADEAVKLDAFTVAAKRDMAASDVAVNEQRYAPGIKNIVSTDSFADIADGNVGEFAKYLPGVTLNRSGSDGLNLSLGGVPPSGTPILQDGMGIASAASSNASRTVEFENIAVGSLSRVEVSRSPTPDSPASAIGGSVNLVSKSAFERSRPQYTIKPYLSWRGGDFSTSKQPGPLDKKVYPFEPNIELGAVVPVTRNFGYTVSGLIARTRNNGPGTTENWVPNSTAQSGSLPATTPDAPYLSAFRVQERPKLTVRDTISVSTDWRLSPGNVLTLGVSYFYFTAEFWVRQLNYNLGTVASFGPNFTQSRAGAGIVQIVTDARHKANTSYAPTLRFKHTGPVWEYQLSSSYSNATNHYGSYPYFQTNNAYVRNLTLRFDDEGKNFPATVTATDPAGKSVDLYNLSNYHLETVGGLLNGSSATVRTVNAYAKRYLDVLHVPVVFKPGFDLHSESRDMLRTTYANTFLGKDGITRTADDAADQWYDPSYTSKTLINGAHMQWPDLYSIGDTFKTHPEYFTNTEADAVTAYKSRINTSQAITETIAAPYLRLDGKFLEGRLNLTGGVRYEWTNDDGYGPLIDPTRLYQRDASGNIIHVGGKPVPLFAATSLAGTKLTYLERGSHVKKDYDGFFPSLNASFNVLPDLIARASYGRSINRPDFSNTLPSMNLPDTESTSTTIALTNPNLRPWTAKSYGVALEYYFDGPSTGVVSARAYRRDISDFWGSTSTPATDELLAPYGIDPEVYGAAKGYKVSTTTNVGSARVSGLEFDYRQNLGFLPHWARGLTVFGNITMQHLQGSSDASFTGFVGRTINWGITFSRERFTVRLAANLRGRVKGAAETGAGAEPGTYDYTLPRNSADFNAEYRFTRNLSFFVSGRNVNKAIDDGAAYGPHTPSNRIITSHVEYGATWYVGVKSTF